ncbi:hypothetical protein TRFO_34951 [Tritrichomonas foetus]|uniref:Guanylate cyclase domain-containing protein n=1 Tax=Tritrichomonas foetus TaxID=1144522 RepID=A0A1J4JM65_9EUKA|nr:hypothetical protein TRFO_34951 [Tritrichomonas foetus]|eukprot:OHS98621.1 hypothetical protein TRFO_34951 [Tritrichomonas foetus]
MITPDEAFNPFEATKLNRNKSSSYHNIIGNINVTMFNYYILNFIHLMNRTVNGIHSISWFRWFILFYRIFFLSVAPFSILWKDYPHLSKPFKIITYILVYVRSDSSYVAQVILFVMYIIFLLFLFILCGTALFMIKKNRRTSTIIHGIYFMTYLIFPVFSGSMAYLFTNFAKSFFLETTIANFFITVIAIISLIALLCLIYSSAVISGSNPIPEISDPLSVWASNCQTLAVLQTILALNHVVMCIMEDQSKLVNGILLLVLVFLIMIPFIMIFCKQVFTVAYLSYEFNLTLISTFCMMNIFTAVLNLGDFIIPFYIITSVWLVSPFALFFSFRLFVNHQLASAFDKLDVKTLEIMELQNERKDGESRTNKNDKNKSAEPNFAPYDQMGIKSGRQAVEFIRAACVFNTQAFLDLSLLKWITLRFPESTFEILQLAFLIPNEENIFHSTFDIYQNQFSPRFIHNMVIFQMVMSIQESSNDLTPTILREVSKQKLSAMKCQSITSKFWTSCYKGDISQMSRMALNLQTNIEKIDSKWRHLLSRYPRSHPILKEYLCFLNGIGCQHGLADNIVRAFPSLAEPKEGGNEDDINMGTLQHAIEKSVDRRPLKSVKLLNITLYVMIILSMLFIFATTIFSIFMCLYFTSSHNFIQSISNIESSISTIGIKSFDIYNNVINARLSLAQDSIMLENAILKALDTSTNDELYQFALFSLPLNFSVDKWDAKIEMNMEESIHILSYFSNAMVSVNNDDPIFSLYKDNMPYIIKLISKIGTYSLNKINVMADFFLIYGRIFHGIVWDVLVLFIIPMIYISLKNIKAEMTYLFSFYINIPHTMLAKFAEGIVGVAAGKSIDRKSQLMRLSASFVQSKTETNEDNENLLGNNVIDGFKVLVGNTSSRASVLPKNFALKAVLVIGLTSAFFAIISSVSFELLRSFIINYSEYLWTERAASERMSSISICCAIISDFCMNFTREEVEEALKIGMNYHLALLSNDKTKHISSTAVSQSNQQSLLFDERCENQTEITCRSFTQVFDHFTNQLSLLIGLIFEGTVQNNTEGQKELFDMRRIYIDDLHPMLTTSFKLFSEFSASEIKNHYIHQIIILVGSIVSLIFIIIFLLLPITREIGMTLYSVRLPMKLIDPLDIVEIPRMVQYLQGECDWSSNNGSTDKGSDKRVVDLLFNILRSPLGVFGSDLSLLLANDEFYMLLNTSREACVGLPLSDIFSTVIPFERDESHPFNNLLSTVSQLQRGISPVNVMEVNCDLQIQGKGRIPVLIRLVGIAETQNNVDDETVCADHFAIFITDLKPRKILEEKMKFESEMTMKLLDTSIPRMLSQVIQNDEGNNIHTFENIPLVMFQIKHESIISDTDDTAIKLYSHVMKVSHELNQVFAAMVRLMYRPPYWLYVSGLSVGAGDPNFCISEACLFALNVADKFNEIEHDMFSINIAIHFGSCTIVVVPLELPQIEIIGQDFKVLKHILSISEPGVVVGTKEMADVIVNNQCGIVANLIGKAAKAGDKTYPLYAIVKEEEIIAD